jgi:hypothetical protein
MSARVNFNNYSERLLPALTESQQQALSALNASLKVGKEAFLRRFPRGEINYGFWQHRRKFLR